MEQSIIAEGCRDALIVWDDIIVDGHNRYKVCKAHNIDFQTKQKTFGSREETMLWMLQNQLGRRNLNDFQRVEIVRKNEGVIKAQAGQRMLAGKGDPKVNLPEGQKLRKQSRDELGKLAGVSGSTYEHVAKVMDEAPAPVVEAARNKELSINAAYGVTKLPEAQQAEIAERIGQGEVAKSVISEVKSRNRKIIPATQTNTVDDVAAQTTSPETSQRNDDGIATKVSPDTKAKELPPKVLTIPTVDVPTIQPAEQEENIKDVVAALADSETQPEPQTRSEVVEDVTIPSHRRFYTQCRLRRRKNAPQSKMMITMKSPPTMTTMIMMNPSTKKRVRE